RPAVPTESREVRQTLENDGHEEARPFTEEQIIGFLRQAEAGMPIQSLSAALEQRLREAPAARMVGVSICADCFGDDSGGAPHCRVPVRLDRALMIQ
ncbi:MAG: hypothetical protein WBN86_05850, partial [Porticoccaceae bacterium]